MAVYEAFRIVALRGDTNIHEYGNDSRDRETLLEGHVCRSDFSGWKCLGCSDLLPASPPVCTGCWNGKQRCVSLLLYQRPSAIPFGGFRSPHCSWLLSKQTREPMQLQTECFQPSSAVAVGLDCRHLDSASAGIRRSRREAPMKRRNVGLGLAALAVFAGLFYLYGGHQTPTGQAPLADLNAANLGELKNEFNGSQASVRMLVLLSPT